MNPIRITVVCFAVALALAGTACDGNGGNGGDADIDTGGDPDVPIDTPVDTSTDPDAEEEPEPFCAESTTPCTPSACHAPPFTLACVAGTITDELGNPIPDQNVVACPQGDSAMCFFGSSDADGFWAVSIPGASADSVAFFFPGAADRVTPFCLYDTLCDGVNHFCDDFRLYPAPTPGTDIPGTVDDPLPSDLRIEASDGAAVILPAGAEIQFGLFTAPRNVALMRFPIEEYVPCFVDPANLPIALYAVHPYDVFSIVPGTHLDKEFMPAALDLPNDSGLTVGTEVDVYVLGGFHPTEAGLHEGEWIQTTTATVNAEGTRIETAPGAGLGYLTWFAIYE